MHTLFTRAFLGVIRSSYCKVTDTRHLSKLSCLKLYASQWSTNTAYSSKSRSEFSLANPAIVEYIDTLLVEYHALSAKDAKKDLDHTSRLKVLRPLIEICNLRDDLKTNLSSLKEMCESSDKELASLAKEESQVYKEKLEALEYQLLELLLPKDPHDDICEVVMEISAGVGGQEAMLFARELHDMYIAYAYFKGWDVEIAEFGTSGTGGLRYSSMFISGHEVFRYLKHEAGVHRVQRIPVTERSGRVHTSTVSIVVMAQPHEVQVEIKDKDLKIDTKRASGAGGQHVNTTDSAVRVTHIPTGITVECQVDRSQIRNRQYALQRLRAKLYQLQLDEQIAKANATRKLQVKSNLRSEKIRTYNFNQDRITDHRLSDNVYNMENFLSGGKLLDELLQQLESNSSKELFWQIISENRNSQ